jgi:hypothetical protein
MDSHKESFLTPFEIEMQLPTFSICLQVNPMKKLVIATLLLGSTSLVRADYSLTNSDGSDASALCIASTTSPSAEALDKTAHSLGFTRKDMAGIRCNGMPLAEFQQKYHGAAMTPVAEPVHYVLKKMDDSPVTELCAAAASSDQEYLKVKTTYFRYEKSIESDVTCNGMSLKSFVRKYGGADTKALSQR